MKKKSLLISGLIVLGAAVGVTSYAVSSGAPGISLFADGDDEEVKPVVPTVFSPARGSYHLASENVNSAYLEFEGTVVSNFSEDKEIALYLDKSTSSAVSYQLVKKWPSTESEAISLDGNRLNIAFGENLDNGTYYIDVPEGVVLVDGIPNAGYDHNDANKQWSFIISSPVDVSSVYPENNQVIGSSVNLQTLTLTYSGLGDQGISNINRSIEGNVVVKRGEEVVYTISPSDTNAIKLDSSWPDKANIKLPAPLTEGGVYTVEVPAGLFLVKGLSAAVEWSFTIQAEVNAEWSMVDGGTYPFSSFATFTLTYPEGTTIAVNPGVVAKLNHFYLGQNVEISAYSATVSGNVVTLKADDMSKMTVAGNKSSNYMTVDIPAGLLTITTNGSSYQNPALTCGKFLAVAFGQDDFQFIPAVGSDVTIDQIKEITLLVPDGATYCGQKTATTTIVTVLPNNSANTSYTYSYTFKSISDDGKQVVAVLNEKESGLTGNLAYFQKGEAYIKVAANLIQLNGTTNKNTALTFKGFNVTDGIQTAPIYDSTPADGAGVTSIQDFNLRFPCNVVVNDENAEITLSLNGKVVKSVKAGETTTAAAKADGAGANNVGYSKLFVDAEGKAITAPGVYTYNVPAGAFKQVGQNYLSTAYEATVYIVQNIDYSIDPKPATFSGTSTALVATPGTEFTELTSFTLTYAENATVELTEDWKNALGNSAIGKVAASNLLKNPITSTPSNEQGYSFNNAVVDGNKITIYLNKPFNIATPPNYGIGLKIAQGAFIVNVPGEDGTVTQYANAEIKEYYQGVPMGAGRIGVLSLGANGSAEAMYLTAEDNGILASELDEICYTGYQALYPANTTPKAELRDEDGNVIATYTGAAVDTEAYPGMSSTSVMFTPDAEYAAAVAALETDIYNFVVLNGTLQGGSATSATLKVFNTSDFVYELRVLQTKMTPSVEDGSAVPSLSTIDFSFSDVLAIAIDEAIVPIVTYEATYTEGIFEGEKYKVNIAEEGYTVALKASGMPEEEALALADGDDDFGFQGGVAQLVITPALTPTDEHENTYSIHIPAGAMLLNGVVKSPAIDLTVNVEAPNDVEFDDYISKATPAGDDITLSDTFYGMGMGNIVVAAKAGTVVNTECAERAELSCVIPELGIDEPMVVGMASVNEIFDMDEGQDTPTPGVMALAEGEDTNYLIQFELVDDGMQMLLTQPGIWIVTIPEGMFTANGATVKEGSLQYTLIKDSKEYTWTISPEDGTEFEKALSGQIVLTVEGAEYVTYDTAPATMTDAEGAKVGAFNTHPKVEGNTIVWSFYENSPYEFKDGEYTLTISANTIGADMDAEVIGEGNFPAENIVVKYIVKNATPEVVEFEDYIVKGSPAGDDITLNDTFYGMGMGNIVVTAKDGAVLNTESTGKAQLMCILPELGIEEPMTIATASVDEIFDMSAGPAQPEPLAEGGSTNYLLQFELVSESMDVLLTQPGIWIVTIPEGLFTVNGANVSEGSLQYTLIKDSKEYTWTISPEDGTVFEDALSGQIVLTVEGAEYVTYDTVPATMTDAEGAKVGAFNNYPKASGNTLTWSFYPNSDYVFADGTYTLTIRANTIGADMDAEVSEGNFPAENIVVSYIVRKGLTGVALIGVDAADSYDVYTMDGKVVLLNADNDAMLNLAPGMYIINGKKAFVRK